MEGKLPVTVTLSTALHLGGAFGWLYMHQVSNQAPARVISNVDLMVTRRAAATPAAVRRPSPPSTWNFLKMALPSIPQAIKPLEIKTPEASKKILMDSPEKIQDRGRLKQNALEPLDLSRRKSAAALDVGQLEARDRRALAEGPKLEEVGVRRAPRKVLEMAALADEQRGRLQPQALGAMDVPRSAHAAPSQALLPEEAAQAPSKSLLGKLAAALPAEAPLGLEPRDIGSGRPSASMDALKPTLPKQSAGPLTEKKKAMEIEGPLANRRIVSYEVPRFPDWASAQGIMEAEVRIRFYVSAAGDVLPEMRVEQTSGYGRLDRLAMDSLSRWKFEPAGGGGRQWGIITFRFLLE